MVDCEFELKIVNPRGIDVKRIYVLPKCFLHGKRCKKSLESKDLYEIKKYIGNMIKDIVDMNIILGGEKFECLIDIYNELTHKIYLVENESAIFDIYCNIKNR